MSVSVTTNIVEYTGDDSTVDFSFTFPLFDDDDLEVVITDEAGTQTTLVKDVGYTMSETAGNSDWSEGGTVTTVATYTATDTIKLQRVLEYTQSVVLEEGDAFPAKTIENTLDRLVMLAQQTKNDSVNAILTELEGVSGYDADEVQLLGHTATGDWCWYTASIES